jgi:hypothetical protein
MTLEPAATAVAIPAELIVATAAFTEFQLAVVLTSPVESSLYVAVAVNCWVAPKAMLAVLGDAEIVLIVFAGGAMSDPLHPVVARINGRERDRKNI